MISRSSGFPRWLRFAAAALLLVAGGALLAQSKREFTVSAQRYAYRVDDAARAVIQVRKDDVVRVTFSAEDIPHSFTIDEYRISRRAEPGKPVTFEFHANRAGEFRIYCNLAIDDRCLRELTGVLIVEDR